MRNFFHRVACGGRGVWWQPLCSSHLEENDVRLVELQGFQHASRFLGRQVGRQKAYRGVHERDAGAEGRVLFVSKVREVKTQQLIVQPARGPRQKRDVPHAQQTVVIVQKSVVHPDIHQRRSIRLLVMVLRPPSPRVTHSKARHVPRTVAACFVCGVQHKFNSHFITLTRTSIL